MHYYKYTHGGGTKELRTDEKTTKRAEQCMDKELHFYSERERGEREREGGREREREREKD